MDTTLHMWKIAPNNQPCFRQQSRLGSRRAVRRPLLVVNVASPLVERSPTPKPPPLKSPQTLTSIKNLRSLDE